jgi:prepilin-type N-terminal cleavage/methylation domain-containing protein
LNPVSSASLKAFTLLEMMFSVSIGGVVLGTAAFQTVFTASDEYYKATSDQMRVLDYIALDMRSATSGSVSNTTQTLTLRLPDYIDYSKNPPAPRTPTIAASGAITYGTNSAQPTVVYTVAGSSPNQTVTRALTPATGPITTTTLTSASANYQFSCFNPGNAGSTANFSFGGAGQPAMITARITFLPKFNRLNLASSRTGTTASMTMLLRNHK